MARDKTDATAAATSAKPSAEMISKLIWETEKVAEDELSSLSKNVAKIETAEQAEQAAAESQRDIFWPRIQALAAHCDEILTEKGFPGAARPVLHLGNGQWCDPPTPEELKKRGGRIVRGEWLTRRFADDFSDEWYAGRLGFKCRLALEHFRIGDAGEPFLFDKVFEIASLHTDWRWRREHKPSILTGRKQRGHLAEVRDKQNRGAKARVEERRFAIASMLFETHLTGGALNKWLKKQLLERYGFDISERTIRDDRKALHG
jgi:hypothetical protein